MDVATEIETEVEPAAQPEKPRRISGAQRRKDTRERVFKDGVWRLPVAEQVERVPRGRPRK